MYKRVIGILLVALLFLFGCSPSAGTTSVAVQTSASTSTSTLAPSPSATPDAVLTRVRGEVSLQRVNTRQTVSALFGCGLWRGDIIVTGQDAQAEALCSDGVSIKLEPNQKFTVTCGEEPDPHYQRIILHLYQDQFEIGFSPRPLTQQTVVLSPRNTKLTNERPEIRWRAVEEGAEEYEVIVSGPGNELWRATTQEPVLPYPEAQPALEAEVTYLIQVTAKKGGPTGTDRPLETVWVTMLPATDVEQVRQFERQVETLDLSVESVHFLLAAYYTDLELYDAAITTLVSLIEETPSPLAHRLLGDLYLEVELDDQVAQSYEEARRLAQEQGNRLVQAEAEVGLGMYAAKDSKEASEHYQNALTVYRELGLESQAEVVQARAEVGLGHVAYAAEDFERALKHYQTALTLYQELELVSQIEAVEKFITKTKD